MRASFFTTAYSPASTPPPIPGPLPANLVLFFGSAVYKSGTHSNHSDLVLLQKQTEATWGLWFPLIYILSMPRVRGCQSWWQPVKPSIRRPLSTNTVFLNMTAFISLKLSLETYVTATNLKLVNLKVQPGAVTTSRQEPNRTHKKSRQWVEGKTESTWHICI